jgi:hypothetical protein
VLVTPPRNPSRATGEIEKLLVELGHEQLDDLDDEREALAEDHDDLFEEIAAFARRGWAFAFDAESGSGFDPEVYAEVLGEILMPLGVESVSFDGDTCVVEIDDRAIHVQRPEQDSDWLDVGWIFDMASLVLARHSGQEAELPGSVTRGREWQLLAVDDEDPHRVIIGIVPTDVWATIHARHQAGAWEAVEAFDPTTNAAYRSPLAMPRRPSARRLMN